MTDGTDTWTYTYDADGMRTSRTDGDVTYEYVYNGGRLTRMTVGSQTLTFGYNANGSPMYVQWNNSRYFYVTNLQGDVTAIVSVNGICVVEYTYDAWGNVLSVTGTRAANLGKYNPLRYRGYVYDCDTEFYYLQSRYYDPEMGRFINADALVSAVQGILSNNMFAYCNNNPSNSSDYSGYSPQTCMTSISDAGYCITIIETWIRACVATLESLGVSTAACGAFILGMYESDRGIYHARTDCLQRFFGYNSLYDWAFEIGTCMDTRQFPFLHDGNSYIIWAWKGDYINLGAGAEMGIYYGTGPHYLASVSLSMPMSMNLNYKGQSIITHSQNTWWITGFNSNYTNVHAYQLTASFTLNFSSNPAMFNSFYSQYAGIPGWTFNPLTYCASYSF